MVASGCRARGCAAVRIGVGGADVACRRGRRRASVGAQLRDAGRAPGGGDASWVAQAGDRGDGRRRQLARDIGSASEPERHADRGPPVRGTASASELGVRDSVDGVRGRVRRRRARRGAGLRGGKATRGCAADAGDRGAVRPAVPGRQRAARDRACGTGADCGRGLVAARR